MKTAVSMRRAVLEAAAVLPCAFAEAVWTAPARPRDYEGFKRRMAVHRRRLIAAGVNCAPLE